MHQDMHPLGLVTGSWAVLQVHVYATHQRHAIHRKGEHGERSERLQGWPNLSSEVQGLTSDWSEAKCV